MEDVSLLVSVLTRINENQLALAAAVEELAVWVEQRGSTDVASNVRGALETLDQNAGFISLALISLKTEGT
ncbi:hypothetical protein VP02_15000 [Pseudomonas ogarae]|uniref:Uncharacterized protein n=1 Tax=Pseudomonas kilonensis TaxID=132476 RepID=A0A0F4XMT1_9PSED|nr:hypothetical protein [Pseudomonas ogarae]KKA07100.1 hypothetical protein VP02_15000 [Pseudomonas ogarae]